MSEKPGAGSTENITEEHKKADQKRQLILEKAREVFAAKGFKTVTMKDIVDACGISRGGLYLYFDSTEQIFAEILKMEAEETDDVFAAGLSEDASVLDVLTLFFKEQKKDILRNKKNLDIALYEYYTGENVPAGKNYLKKQFADATKVLCKLIEAGVAVGELDCDDPQGTAENMMYVLQGMRIMAKSAGVSEKAMDKQIMYLVRSLVIEP